MMYVTCNYISAWNLVACWRGKAGKAVPKHTHVWEMIKSNQIVMMVAQLWKFTKKWWNCMYIGTGEFWLVNCILPKQVFFALRRIQLRAQFDGLGSRSSTLVLRPSDTDSSFTEIAKITILSFPRITSSWQTLLKSWYSFLELIFLKEKKLNLATIEKWEFIYMCVCVQWNEEANPGSRLTITS